MGNLSVKEEPNESDTMRYLETLDDIVKADRLLLKGRWSEQFSHWGAYKWTYIPSVSKPSRLMLLVYVNNENNLLRFPMFIGGLEIVPIVVKMYG